MTRLRPLPSNHPINQKLRAHDFHTCTETNVVPKPCLSKYLYLDPLIVVMNMRPFAKEIREMQELIEYVEREFRREPVHIKLPE